MPNTLLTFTDASTSQPVGLLDDGTIALGGTTGGAWTTTATPGTNQIQYIRPDKSTGSAMPTYTIEANTNRLIVAVNGGAPTPLNGQISFEGQSGIFYTLFSDPFTALNGAGGPLGFAVFGNVSIDPARNTLTVKDPTPGSATLAVIQGITVENGNSAVSAQAGATDPTTNLTPDILSFNAVTTATFPDGCGGTNTCQFPAEIDIAGNWDLQQGQTVFTAGLDTYGGTTAINIALVGRLKAVSYGFQFLAANGQETVLFQIAGQISGTNAVGKWQLSLGYANKQFEADLAVSSAPPNGANGFTIQGSLQLASGGAGGMTIALSLDVAYKFNNGSIDLQVQGANGVYSLQVSGSLNLNVGAGYKVTFSIATSTAGGLQSFDLAFGPANPGSALNSAISGAIGWNGKNVTIDLNVKFNWVGGHLLPQNPPPAP